MTELQSVEEFRHFLLKNDSQFIDYLNSSLLLSILTLILCEREWSQWWPRFLELVRRRITSSCRLGKPCKTQLDFSTSRGISLSITHLNSIFQGWWRWCLTCLMLRDARFSCMTESRTNFSARLLQEDFVNPFLSRESQVMFSALYLTLDKLVILGGQVKKKLVKNLENTLTWIRGFTKW